MGTPQTEERLPQVPADLKYVEFRLPGTFREMVANPNFSHEEIGRIVRCLALNTDCFITQRIGPEVYYYRKHLLEKNATRLRVQSHRKRQKAAAEADRRKAFELGRGVDVDVVEYDSDGVTNGVTVTVDAKSGILPPVAPSTSEKTSTILVENISPIVPLTKKLSSSLEKKPHATGFRQERRPVQADLFSFAAGAAGQGSQETGQEGTQNRSEDPEGKDALQDIESDSRGAEGPNGAIPSGNDSRADSAWIPQKFEVFWAKYPRKDARQAAIKAFTKIIKLQTDVDKFMSVLMASLAYWNETDTWKKRIKKFIPLPATWLNRGSWEDSKFNDVQSSRPEFLAGSEESDDELIKRMEGR